MIELGSEMTRAEGLLLIYAAVMVGGAIRILLDGTKIDAWMRRIMGQPPSKKQKGKK